MKTKILELLEKNAKLSIKEIAEELDIKEKEALQLVGELEADKVICGYSAIINWDKITEEKRDRICEICVDRDVKDGSTVYKEYKDLNEAYVSSIQEEQSHQQSTTKSFRHGR